MKVLEAALNAPLSAKIAWFTAANLIAFGMMLFDKRRAILGDWRIRESTLLIWAAIGGGAGALAAQKMFRHKTRKEPFRSNLLAACTFSAVLMIAVFFVHP